MNTNIKSEQLHRKYLMAGAAAAFMCELVFSHEERDFYNMYDGCAFE